MGDMIKGLIWTLGIMNIRNIDVVQMTGRHFGDQLNICKIDLF